MSTANTEKFTEKVTDVAFHQLNWRYAVKKFDSSKKLTDEQVETLLNGANFAPSSMGAQPFKILVITNPEIREKLKPFAHNQSQITDASHLFVFAHFTKIPDGYVDDYMNRISHARNVGIETLEGFSKSIKGHSAKMDETALSYWTARQAYISLGFLLYTAALEHIDACPMEGFIPDQFDEILGLKEKGLRSVVLATAGYRSEHDALRFAAKVRQPLDKLAIFFR